MQTVVQVFILGSFTLLFSIRTTLRMVISLHSDVGVDYYSYDPTLLYSIRGDTTSHLT
jgi:hypothetical protein